ncbi:DUF3173 domain-containing protein [Enterococcus sp. AZ196]|uniref:DUF3173 domain-containing protein n=1 Tax=Enterococcus sp. AZ196 TaxID=2774659 RepID=UPI003D2C363D
MTRSDLIALGYGPSFSRDIIRKAKILMVQKGFGFYNTKKLGRVPIEAVEEILGMTIDSDDLEKIRKTDGSALIKERQKDG